MTMSIGVLLLVVTAASGLLKVWQKYESRFFDADTFTILIQLISFLLLVPAFFLFSHNTFAPTLFNISLIIAAGTAWYFGSLVTNRSVKVADLTLREPIIQTRLVFVIIFSIVLLGEHVSLATAAGAFLVFAGAVVSSYRPGINYATLKTDGVWLCVLAALLVGIAYTFDKYGLGYIDVFTWAMCMYAVPLVFLIPKTKRAFADVVGKPALRIVSVFILILLWCVVYVALLYVFQHSNLSQSFPFSQLSSVFVFLGGLYLGERTNIRNRTVGALIAIVGGVIIFSF